MWCFCTPSSHHECNLELGKVLCPADVKHCVLGRAGAKVTQSCLEWEATTKCPDIGGKCYIVGESHLQPTCCCKGPLCNHREVNMTRNPNHVYRARRIFSAITTTSPRSSSKLIITWGITICFLILAIVVISFIVKRWLNKRTPKIDRNFWSADDTKVILEKRLDKKFVAKCTKEKLISQGRFGQVWLGKSFLEESTETKTVAIKIFSDKAVNRRSWENESLIYCFMKVKNHPNILFCYGADEVKGSQTTEMWLVVEYHPEGSLYEHLKNGPISWEMVRRISLNVAAGLTHLHSFCFTGSYPIAHRDIKSKNILLKEDLTACIADFGLAICQRNYATSIKNMVGTYNYMAPELLEGSINLTILSFLSVDIFAMALVFWEMINRCQLTSVTTGSFFLAFEQMVGEKPTLQEMRDCVVHNKQRPAFNKDWVQFPEVMSYWKTICECWDEDPEARLTAECVKIRIGELETFEEREIR